MIATWGPKKSMKFSENLNLGDARVCDVEFDSLEGENATLAEQVDEKENDNTNDLATVNGNKEGNSTVKHLNLNNLCKNQGETNELYVDEIVLPGESLQSLSELQILSLRGNRIQNFPASILQLTSLITLDISDNCLLTLPPEISQLRSLKELIIDQNLLSVLPVTIWELKFLKLLRVNFNRLAVPPDKPEGEMRSITLVDCNQGNERKTFNSKSTKVKDSSGLTTLNLRANRLKGHIILGNYSSLTELDVSENNIENLDLGSVEQLQILQCSRNCLTQLTLYGQHLVSVIAGNNRLKTFTTIHPPANLTHLDVSYNNLEFLPDWLSGCYKLRSLFVSNNALTALPDHLFCNEMASLQTVQLAYNQLETLPMMQRKLPIQELFLQNNSLSGLPENFFKFLSNIRVLNLSNNRLVDLPNPEVVLLLEKLYLTANCLIDRSLERIAPYIRNIKILHAAYNSLTALPDNSAAWWSELEELVLSGNKIAYLPTNIKNLKHLAVLRIHSNSLQCIPALSSLLKLRVLDLAHNQLDRIDLSSLIPPNLKFLDLSCNTNLHVDSHQFNTYRTQRPMSLVDVSGKNRTSLPLSPAPFYESNLTECSWSVGFSETPGCKPKLHIAQVRLPAFCNTEALFGLFDGENNSEVPVNVDKMVPRILLEERTVKETANEYMKYTILSTYRQLKSKGFKQGLNAAIVHILKPKPTRDFRFNDGIKKYIMKIVTIGDVKIILAKTGGQVRLLPVKLRRQIRTNPQTNFNIPDPDFAEVQLDEQDEFMVIANKKLWDVMTPETAIKEVSQQRNVILAAKRLQDLAQSYGAEENLSIIVVKFNFTGTSDVDLLMRELRQTITRNKFQPDRIDPFCQPGCCCEALNNECLNCIEKVPISPPIILGDDRSSPSGQSDHACSDCNSSSKIFISQLAKQNENRLFRSVTPSIFESVEVKANPERRSYRGVAKALRQKKEEERSKEDSDSGMSEEQFKCWEYMLEKNTQKLFDKELNTLNGKGMKGAQQFSVKMPSLSRSSPHLPSDNNNNPTGIFLSKQFGSSRSFNPALTKSTSRLGLDKKQILGGPNAAYFGSLQRLMPYNLEYDFALMHERGLVDSLDLDRMQQYWGVATTEL